MTGKVTAGARFEGLVTLDEPSDELFAFADQTSRVSFDLILTVVALEKIDPADLKMKSEEEDQSWEGGVWTFSIAHVAVDLVEGRIVRSGRVKSVRHVLDALHHGIVIGGDRITSGQRSLAG